MTDLELPSELPTSTDRPGFWPRFWNITVVNPTRTLVFCAVGALVGLAIAGYGLFTASGTTTAIYPAEDAAIVNGVPVLMVDLVGQVRALYDVPFSTASRTQKAAALNDMIRDELYVQRGVELGMPTDDIDVRTALVGAAEAQTASEALVTVPTPSELTAFYAANRARYSSEGVMELDDWILPGGSAVSAKETVARLRGGAAPRTLRLTPSGRLDDREQFYFAARIHLGNALFAVAKDLKDGAVSDPVRVGDQQHILIMQRNRPPVAAAYEDAQARVLSDYADMVKKRALAENTKFLFGRAQISVAPSLR